MIEVCFSPSHLDYHDLNAVRRATARIAELGMEAYSFHAPFANGLDISSPDCVQRKTALAEIFRAAEAAAALQVFYFVIHPGPEVTNAPPAEERFRRMEAVVDSLDRLSGRCRELGIHCVLENKLPHLLFGRTSDVLWILDSMKSLDVGVCLDTGHAALSGDLMALLHKLTGHLRMIHAHDNWGERDDHFAPGNGNIPWDDVVTSLAGTRFDGALILELAGAEDAATTLTNARRGRSYLRQVCRRVALK